MTGEKPGPDGYSLDIAHTTEPGYAQRQDDLIFDYQTNVAFIYPGALAFLKDAPHTEVHLLDGGHFVLESHYQAIASLILNKWGD